MELTYELIKNGYIILKDGVKWIAQTDFIPYPGATIEESAQNHINALLANTETSVNQSEEIEKLKEQIAELSALVMSAINGETK